MNLVINNVIHSDNSRWQSLVLSQTAEAAPSFLSFVSLVVTITIVYFFINETELRGTFSLSKSREVELDLVADTAFETYPD